MNSTPSYQVVYDVAHLGLWGWLQVLAFPSFGLLFVAIGVLLVRYPNTFQNFVTRRMGTFYQGFQRVFRWFFLSFAIFWTVLATAVTVFHHLTLSAASRDGTCELAVGVVTDFVAMPSGGHADEHFTVAGIPFSYSDFEITGGFNNTLVYGGPIHEGLRVRICYVSRSHSNVIVRLEVAK